MSFLINYQKLLKRRGSMFGYVIGFIFGFLVSWVVIISRFKNGNFQINETDAMKDVYTLYIDDFDKVHKRKYLLLKTTRK